MIKCIQRIRHFGVFHDVVKSGSLDDFVEKNIIYGWNYAGKTTLSRLFQCLGAKQKHPDFVEATFAVVDYQGVVVSSDDLAGCTKTVEVFNSDFVARNLSWHGSEFQPILLLGEESIEAEQKIAALTDQLAECRRRFSQARESSNAIATRLSDARTATAKRIKMTLRLVEAYTATHLANDVARLVGASNTLTDDQFNQSLKTALATKAAQAPNLAPCPTPTVHLEDAVRSARAVCDEMPPLTTTIEALRADSRLAQWVEKGLELHEAKTRCAFCEGPLDHARIDQLLKHFSDDFSAYKRRVTTAIAAAEGMRVARLTISARDFAEPFIEAAIPAIERASAAIDAYNRDIDAIVAVLRQKEESAFAPLELPVLFPSNEPQLVAVVDELNAHIAANNNLGADFEREKSAAIARLKQHMAAEFCIQERLEQHDKQRASCSRRMRRFQALGERIKAAISDLQATIDRSQKGRDRLNRRISQLLGQTALQIHVVQSGAVERFQLQRGGVPAKNLSDGEKTAIAFAFFLTKLEEHRALRDVIVYIDDPISSLDSNHVFQVYSLIDAFFFRKSASQNGSDEWVTACKQIFISTHNFEFFELLKRLPCNKAKTRYFMVRRIAHDKSTIENVPRSIMAFRSEYHYLFSVIHAFHTDPNRAAAEHLLGLPNAMRRFLELYTYMRLPLPDSTVDQRAEALFGREKTQRILKLLHHFSHLESFDRLATNTNVVADIDAVVDELISLVAEDESHYRALESSLTL